MTDSENDILTVLRHFLVILATVVSAVFAAVGQSADYDGMKPRVAVRANALYCAALTPDLGVELCPTPQWSFAGEAVWAWWSRHSRNRCWRVYGGWIEMRRWFLSGDGSRLMTGHHVGLYGSYHSYDFEFGHKGWQSPQTLGIGIAYGYSLKISRRMNIDFGIKAGYATGRRTEYIPQCGEYVSTYRGRNHYFGITGLEISLVWFPGKGNGNNPVINL